MPRPEHLTAAWSGLTNALGRVPGVAWAAMLAAVIIGGIQALRGGRERVVVVGSGILSALREGDAPDGIRYDLRTRGTEPFAVTAERVEQAISEWPNVIIIGLDDARATDGRSTAEAIGWLEQLAAHAENAAAVPVIVVPLPPRAADLHETRARVLRLCRTPGARVCADVGARASEPSVRQAAIAAATEQAMARHQALRASLFRR